MAEQNQYNQQQQVTLCILYERQTKSGETYLAGRLGMTQIRVWPAKKPAPDGTPQHRLVLSEAPKQEGQGQQYGQRNYDQSPQDSNPGRGYQRSLDMVQAPSKEEMERFEAKHEKTLDEDVPF